MTHMADPPRLLTPDELKALYLRLHELIEEAESSGSTSVERSSKTGRQTNNA